jgi:4a-hydroxytetrahydrobiopterin dehydratase
MAVPKLSDDDIQQHLSRLPGWTRSGDEITKQYRFADFTHAMQFVNHVAEEAESVNHHPDIDIRYDKVTLTLSTHDSGGVTQKDINLAAASDEAADAIAS